MTDTSAKIYLVAGATRGIGLALVNEIASRDPTAFVYAGGRNLAGSPQLEEFAAKYPGRVEIVKYVAGDAEGNQKLAEQIKEKWGRVDTVIANAGVNNYNAKVHEFPTKNFTEHFEVNTLGPIILFQAFRSLLQASKSPRFIAISSSAGSLELLQHMTHFYAAGYSLSKAALNWVVRKIHYENEWLVTFPICPGPVHTDMSKSVLESDKSGAMSERAKSLKWHTADEAATLLMNVIEASTREGDGGQFHSETGGRHPW
ncbi:NAD(P)-binding protein [Pholiota conissans]|uniref:NAD(P)-binding protein n=1 Tax=Pholiota conissans TaxID=109636 RepID=A0A9P5YUC9_9AGAR|nr:NAD(P)-binding protein [Pholiota conissans]